MTISRLILFFCAALLASACTAPASRTAGAPAVATNVPAAAGDTASAPGVAASPEEDPLVCESVMQTGTRVAKRVCMRRSDMEKGQRDAHEMLEGVQRRGVQAGNETKE